MLRTNPTRIELKQEDIKEYEDAKKHWTVNGGDKQSSSISVGSSAIDTNSNMGLKDRIEKNIHNRIGFQPIKK